MTKLRSNKGITMVVLIITIVLIVILTTVAITSVDDGTEFRKYSLMCSDIEQLENKILYFYREYGELPIESKVTNVPDDINNGNEFYKININQLSGITLNLSGINDKYIVDAKTFEVYYLNGIEYNGKIYYTD